MLFFFKHPTTTQYMNTMLGLVVVSLWYCVVVLLCCCVVVSVLLCHCVVVMYFSPRCIKMECGNSEKHALTIHITSIIT